MVQDSSQTGGIRCGVVDRRPRSRTGLRVRAALGAGAGFGAPADLGACAGLGTDTAFGVTAGDGRLAAFGADTTRWRTA
jgi:hypothetical protein